MRIGPAVLLYLGLSASTASAAPGATAGAQAPGNAPIFYVGSTGPYALRVAIHPPDVIPGRAEIVIESDDADLEAIRLLALPLDAEQAAFPPTPDRAERSLSNPHRLTGQLWLMSSGSWQVRILADGKRGPGQLSIPVPALPTHVASMPLALGVLLLGLLLLLALGVVSIVSAAVREGQLAPGERPGAAERKRGRLAAVVAAVVVLGVIVFGGRWWVVSASAHARSVYRPLSLSARVEGDGQLELTLEDPGWLPSRKLDDLVAPEKAPPEKAPPEKAPPEKAPMDLWVVGLPRFENVWHLHPQQLEPSRFSQALPAMPPGHYELFASVVHANGLEESMQQEVTVPAIAGRPLAPADARGLGSPFGDAEAQVAALPNGGKLRLEADRPPVAGEPCQLRLLVEDRFGRAATDLEPLLGRRALGIVVSADLGSFGKLSTRGTVAPAAWAIANSGAEETAEAPSSELIFPYEFPHPGPYRLFIQIRRAGQNEIAMLDLRVL
jgi:hypothetical protein